MQTINEQLVDWIIKRIKTDFRDEVGLLIGEEAYKLDSDRGQVAMSFFFPASEKANQLARTFIIGGIGYDLFPMSWERMERIARLEEDNAPVLLDAQILYTGIDQDKTRFVKLQEETAANLKNTMYTYRKALEKLAVAMELYQTMVFEDSLYKVRKAAGHIVLYLANAVAYTNHSCLRRGHYTMMAELASMSRIPHDFITLVQAVVQAETKEDIKQRCYEIIYNTRRYLKEKNSKTEEPDRNHDYQGLASWYHELSYLWREIYHFCDAGDAVKAFLRSCNLQSEIDIISEEFGLPELDLLGAFHPSGLADYRQQAAHIEQQIRSIVFEHGAVIDEYPSIADFLNKNK